MLRFLKMLRDHTPLGRVAVTLVHLAHRFGFPVSQRIKSHLPYRGVVTVELGARERFFMRSRGHVIENSIYWDGLEGHEADSTGIWAALSRCSETIIDIGANTGLYSLIAAAVNPAARVIAIEPIPRIASIIRENLSLNPEFSVEVYETAVGNQIGDICIFDPGGDQPSSASLIEGFVRDKTKKVSVPLTTIDQLVSDKSILRVGLIKLDVEGVEELALQGMRELVERERPSMLIEVLDDRPALLTELSRLRNLGYVLFDLADGACAAMSADTLCPESRNLLAIDRGRLTALGGIDTLLSIGTGQ